MQHCKKGYVYIIKADTGHYKIGKSSNVPRRMSLFAVKLPFDFEMINYFHCDDMHFAENLFHKIYKPQHVRGEWFDLKDYQVELLSQIRGFRRVNHSTTIDGTPIENPVAELMDKRNGWFITISSVKV